MKISKKSDYSVNQCASFRKFKQANQMLTNHFYLKGK